MQEERVKPGPGLEARTGPAKGERVSCPSCGHQLFRIAMVKEPETTSFAIEIKCKGGGCHRMLVVVYNQGRFSVAVA